MGSGNECEISQHQAAQLGCTCSKVLKLAVHITYLGCMILPESVCYV